MGETGRSGLPVPPGGPPAQEVEERWKEVVETLTERPRDVELLVKAGQLSEQLRRTPEAFTYYRKAFSLDPSKSFLVSKLKSLAVTPQHLEEVTKISRRPASFAASLGGIFKYPVKGKGLPVLIIGAIFLWIARSLMKHGIGTSGITIAALAGAYMAMFYIDVCHTTVGGEDELPDWPDPLRINEVFLDVGKYLCATIAAFLPIVLILVVFGASLFSMVAEDLPTLQVPPGPVMTPPRHEAEEEDETVRTPPASAIPAPTPAPAPIPALPSFPLQLVLTLAAILVFALVGLVYLPMAKLANVVMGSPWTCFNYPFIVHSIAATRRDYLICLGCYLGTSLVLAGAEIAVGLANLIVITGVGLAFLELYGMTVLMRLMGLFYRMNQAKLAWMAD